MTYHTDPGRWTQAEGDAPELLRHAFQAGSHEGPSNLQMRTLALKLAAVGTGAALAAGASTAQASTTAASTTAAGGAVTMAKAGGALTLGKIAVSLALVGAAATGAVYLRRSDASQQVRQNTMQQVLDAQDLAPAQPAPVGTPTASAVTAPVVEKLGSPVAVAAPARKNTDVAVASLDKPAQQAEPVEPQRAEPQPTQAEPQAAVTHDNHHMQRQERRATSVHAAESAPAASTTAGTTPTKSSPAPRVSIEGVAGQRQQLSEIELLRSARSALAARPREAYRLAEEHKSLYPEGVFAQERDALAVEALQRAGDLKLARKLAEAFVQRYPSSPHAHRFRETMNLP
ncbi:MAG: hypothetical protein JWN48_4971 [Myxococcaceae bacterium]|nr:hypothetical protein [Myxococcaceae bacterium]